MTVTEMATAMGLMLLDPDEDRYDATLKVQALNEAQYRVIKFLPSDLLTELQTSKASLAVPATGYDLTGLDTTPGPLLPGRYVNCYVSAESVWAGHIWIDEIEFRQNTYMAGTDEAPISYIFGGYLYIELATQPTTATLYYVRRPKEMVKAGIVGYQVTTSELDTVRHDMVVEAACGLVLRWDGELRDSAQFMNHVGSELVGEIQTFNLEKRTRKIWR